MHPNDYWLASACYEVGLSKKSKTDCRLELQAAGLSRRWRVGEQVISQMPESCGLVGAQAELGCVWQVSVGSRVGLLAGLVELDGS